MAVDINTESDLHGLIRESESMVLEFKRATDFVAWPQTKQKIAQDLSKEVSAFANSYGGQIVLGIKESSDTPRRAEEIEGIDPRRPSIESIQPETRRNTISPDCTHRIKQWPCCVRWDDREAPLVMRRR